MACDPCRTLVIRDADGVDEYDLDTGAEPGAGADNPYRARTIAGDVRVDPLPVELLAVEGSNGIHGAEYLDRSYGLRRITIPVGITADTPEETLAAANALARIVDEGSREGRSLHYALDEDVTVVTVEWLGVQDLPPAIVETGEPSAVLGTFQESAALTVTLRLIAQPFFMQDRREATVNLIGNATLLGRAAGPSGTPDGWAWDSTTGITNQAIDPDVMGPDVLGEWRGAFTFRGATVSARRLQRTTNAASFSIGNAGAASFYVRADVAGRARFRSRVEYLNSSGVLIGSAIDGPLVDIGTDWTRVEHVAAAAPALTDRVRQSIVMENAVSGAVDLELVAAQFEAGAEVTQWRPGPQVVRADPTLEGGHVAFLYNGGSAPARSHVRVQGPTASSTNGFRRLVWGVQRRRPAALANSAHVLRSVAGTEMWDTVEAANGSFSGSTSLRTTFATNDDYAIRAIWSRTGPQVEPLRGGRYLVIARIMGGAAIEGEIGLEYGPGGDSVALDRVAYSVVSTDVRHVALGVIAVDPAWDTLRVSLYASRTSGGSNLETDYLELVPVDDQAGILVAPFPVDDRRSFVSEPPGMGDPPLVGVTETGGATTVSVIDVDVVGDLPVWAPPGLSVLVLIGDDAEVVADHWTTVLTRDVTASIDVPVFDLVG